MKTAPKQCSGTEGEVCNFFLLSDERDFHEICTSCHGQVFSINSHSRRCKFWANEKWDKVQMYMDRLAEQHERKREALLKSSSSTSSGFSGPHQIPNPIFELSPLGIHETHSVSPGSSLDHANVVVTTLISTSLLCATFACTSTMSGEPDMSIKLSFSASDSGKSEPSLAAPIIFLSVEVRLLQGSCPGTRSANVAQELPQHEKCFLADSRPA